MRTYILISSIDLSMLRGDSRLAVMHEDVDRRSVAHLERKIIISQWGVFQKLYFIFITIYS